MFAGRLIVLGLLLICSFGVFAQSNGASLKDKQERQLKLLEQVLADAKNLRLPENRALVFARAGNAYWQPDEKYARKLFQDAVGELIAAQTEAENEKVGRQYQQALIYGQSPRNEIINYIAVRDADLALDYFTRSRPAAIAGAMQGYNNLENGSVLQSYANMELATEQRLLGLAAEQNPKTAVKRVRESLKTGISYETLNLLRKIYAKDPETADQLSEEIAERFLSTDFSKSSQLQETAAYFIADMGRERSADEKSPKIPESLLRRLVGKMTSDWLASKENLFYGFNNLAPIVEKMYPERAAQLKKRAETATTRESSESQEYNKLLASDLAPEEMVSRAEKLPGYYRNEIYRSAANKYIDKGELAQAEKLMQSNISGDQADYYMANFYTNLSFQLGNQGKYDEAIGYINRIPDEFQRVNALINLANSAYQKDQKENAGLAIRILNQARGLVANTPETQNDFNAASLLAGAYAPFDADSSFNIIESMLPTMNELMQANYVLMKFRAYGGIRQGEMQLVNGNGLGVYNLENTLRVLKDKDFDRALQISSGFTRLENRVWLEMQLIDDNFEIANLPVNSRVLMGKIDR